MPKIRVYVLILTAILVPAPALAFVFDPGETGGTFLKIGVGAGPVGMGEAYTALAGDVSALYWNPAGLVGVKNLEASFMHLEWFQGIRYENLSYAQPLGNFGVLGLAASGLYTTIEGRVSGAPGASGEWALNSDGYYVVNGPTYPAYDLGFIVSSAYLLDIAGNPLALGASLKGMIETIDTYSGFGAGVDMGGIYHLNDATWYKDLKLDPADLKLLFPKRIGIVVQNLGGVGAMRQGGEGSALPIALKAGIGYDFSFLGVDNLALGIDLHQPLDNQTRLNLGGEYKYNFEQVASFEAGGGQVELSNLTVAGRLGYRVGGGIQSDLDALSGLSGGLGLGATIDTVRYELDYSLVPYGLLSQDSFLSSTHRVSLTVKFGQETGKIRKAN
jgi:hypothetical protein